MSFEAITAISAAEEKARQMKAEALAAAKAAEAAAVEEGKLTMEAARKKAESEVRELRAKSDEKAKQDAVALASDGRDARAGRRAHGQGRGAHCGKGSERLIWQS